MLGFITANINSHLAVTVGLLKNGELNRPGRDSIAKAEAYYNEQTMTRFAPGMSGYRALTTLFVARLGIQGAPQVAELIEGDLVMLADMLRADASRYRFV